MAKGETRYQRIHRLIREGQCGLLPLDLTCPCPKRNGPDHPHSDHPGKVGFLTCRGCDHHADVYFNNRVCTHPKARQVAARWLAEQENASDLVGGVSLDDKDDVLAEVLLDLSQTATIEASVDVAETTGMLPRRSP